MDDLISRQAALDCFHDWIDRHGDVHTPDEMAEYIAIEALPFVESEKRTEELTETHSCDYCHEDSDGYVKPIEKNCHAVIFGSVLYLKANGWRGEVEIKYCPMCGRRLER